MGLKSKDIRRLTKQAQAVARPRVYVGTYAKYSNGSIAGEWLNLDDYYDIEDFLNAARELHKDEEDPEFMFQDFENVPDWAYSEGRIDPKFWEFMEAAERWGADRQTAFQIFCDYYYGDAMADTDILEAVEEFDERYQGRYVDIEDYVYGLVEDLGIESLANAESYFDAEKFANDLKIEGWSYATQQDVDNYPDDYPDGQGTYDPDGEFYNETRLEEVVEQWFDDGSIGKEQILNYFDYGGFARDLELSGDIYEQDGHIFNAS